MEGKLGFDSKNLGILMDLGKNNWGSGISIQVIHADFQLIHKIDFKNNSKLTCLDLNFSDIIISNLAYKSY